MKRSLTPLTLPLLQALFIAGFITIAHSAVLLEDDYRAMKLEMISSDVVGAHTEYHYLPEAAPRGNWVVSCFRTDPSQRAWRLIEENGERFIWQSYPESDRERPYTHPMLIAGDDLWTDYSIDIRFAPERDQFQNGIVFRYRNDRVYYFAGVIGQKAVLKKVNGGVSFRKLDETILAEQSLAWTPGEFIGLTVTATGDRLTADFNDGRARLEARDGAFKQGRIGFTSDVPTKFGRVRVTCSNDAKAGFEKARKERDDEEAKLQAAQTGMVVWKKIPTAGFGVGRNLRFGDLDGDGRLDILVVQVDPIGPNDGHCQVGCMTALTLDGKRLWQNGTPDSWRDHLTSDVGVQIHDFDGDGTNDVVYCRDMKIIVAEGATGKTKYEAPTPESGTNETRRTSFPRILGDAIYFADFHGRGAKRDLVIKDRYWNVWAYDNKLKLLWTLPRNTGHYPFAFDVDGDGKDELAIGYSLLSHDGKIIWSLQEKIEDHADGVAILQRKPGGPLMWQCVASDEGVFFADMKGNILTNYQVGHAQNASTADYRPDLPGLETVTINFWGNQGIVNFFDADGKKYHDFEPAQHGSMMLPLNWRGDGQEYWILSANPDEGAYDGWGRRVLRFPADGHPDMCVATLDLTGDARDEIVVWDPWEIWIYTQADNPKSGRLYKPKRNPLFNYSNYQTTVSLPGWTE
jgi:hypothetical protein